MSSHSSPYVVVGAGLAAASAVDGIREHDETGSILILGAEPDLPYDRPPLSKQLWFGAKREEEVTLHDAAFYAERGVELRLGTEVVGLDPAARRVRDHHGATIHYQKLLLATGGTPRRLAIPGGDLDGLCYFRTLADYRRLREEATRGKSALVVGGGFIGSEIAAALTTTGLRVTMIFPGPTIGSRIFHRDLGNALTALYRDKGIEVLAEDKPLSIDRIGSQYRTRTQAGRQVISDVIVVGIGIAPNIGLAQGAGLATGDGVVVDQFLQTSHADVYAAGDLAYFPEAVLGPRRIEHWDNAGRQGKHAGGNMAGAGKPFTEIPFFFSDLFEFGYEAVGETDSRYQIFADWQDENKTGVVYYLKDRRVRGALMCNLFGKVEAATALIRRTDPITPKELHGAIR